MAYTQYVPVALEAEIAERLKVLKEKNGLTYSAMVDRLIDAWESVEPETDNAQLEPVAV